MPTTSNTTNGTNGAIEKSAAAISARATAEEALTSISRDFHNFVDDVEKLLKATSTLTGEELVQAKAKLNERVAAARVKAGEVRVSLTERARTSAAAGKEYVQEQPWQAVGIGAAVGVLVGLLLTRRD